MANIVKFILPRAGIILSRYGKTSLFASVRLQSNQIPNLHKVNNLEKKFLVWTGKYKSVAEVPEMVRAEAVEKARNKMRIRIANIMMGVTLIACLFVALSGKRAQQRGESVLQQNIDWHKKVKEDDDKKKAAAAAASS